MKYWKETMARLFIFPEKSENICKFCFWASRNEEYQTSQEIAAKAVEKYLFNCEKNLLKCRQLTCGNSRITQVLSKHKLGCAVTVHDLQSLRIKC